MQSGLVFHALWDVLSLLSQFFCELFTFFDEPILATGCEQLVIDVIELFIL